MVVRQTDGRPSEGLADDCQTTDHDGLQVWTWKAFGRRHEAWERERGMGRERGAWRVKEERCEVAGAWSAWEARERVHATCRRYHDVTDNEAVSRVVSLFNKTWRTRAYAPRRSQCRNALA